MSDAFATSPRPGHARRIGVLLVNLGTPDATDYWSVRRYLKEFLSDRRVIEENPVKWWLVLNLIILTVRPGRKGRDYDKIWNKERNESPLKTITRSQSDKLAEILAKVDPRIRVDWAMRYGNPSIASRLDALRGAELRPHPAGAALSAIRRRHHGDGLRRGLRRARQDALSADACAWPRPISPSPSISTRSPIRSPRRLPSCPSSRR